MLIMGSFMLGSGVLMLLLVFIYHLKKRRYRITEHIELQNTLKSNIQPYVVSGCKQKHTVLIESLHQDICHKSTMNKSTFKSAKSKSQNSVNFEEQNNLAMLNPETYLIDNDQFIKDMSKCRNVKSKLSSNKKFVRFKDQETILHW